MMSLLEIQKSKRIKTISKEREWNEKNAAFIKVYNQKVEEDGVALAEWRGF